MPRALLVLSALAIVVAACGGGSSAGDSTRAGETATLWVTRDRGAEVVLEKAVPAGSTALQALDREADVETRYGGRFVQAVDGIEGSLDARRDWFYFLNGIEPDLGGADVTVHAGDVIWWDFRSWADTMAQPVVVGAFPEPFLHGWDGKRRPADVRAPPELANEADALRRVLGGGDGTGDPNVFALRVEPGADGAALTADRGAGNDSPVTFTLGGSLAAVRAAAAALARDPSIVRFRYEARFDDDGNLAP
ncbi:MAG: DUF4430 domain-containing protein [Thermoleophilia bacterium]|nr:DUF4430 domain-containing protein [Thermoleophilia bacterium]